MFRQALACPIVHPPGGKDIPALLELLPTSLGGPPKPAWVFSGRLNSPKSKSVGVLYAAFFKKLRRVVSVGVFFDFSVDM